MRKQITLIVICLILFAFTTAIISCADNTDLLKKFVCGDNEVCVYEDTIFYVDENGSLRYQNINDMQKTGKPLYSDVLSEDGEDPFANTYGLFMLVDPVATYENGGAPVLLISHEYQFKEFDPENPNKQIFCNRIVSFDTATNRLSVIKDEITEVIQSLDIYGDTIIYTTSEGDLGYNIHRINKNGKNYKTLNNPEKENYRIHTVYNDKIYYYTETGRFYSCDLALEESEYLFDAITYTNASFFADGYIYYYINAVKNNVIGYSNTVNSYDIARRSVDDINTQEIILENVTFARNLGDDIIYWSLDNASSVNGKLQLGAVLNLFDLETKKTSILYDMKDQDVQRYIKACTDEYIIGWDWSLNDSSTGITCINIKTGEEIQLPDY